MRLGLIGLGKMGLNMARRLMQGGHEVVAHDRSPEQVQAAIKDGAEGADSVDALIKQLPEPRVVWLMVPAGDITEKAVIDVAGGLFQAVIPRNSHTG